MTTKVEFTNRSKPALYLKDNTYNYQTCITMVGAGATEYIGIIWTDILRAMEHYASETPPSPAIEGQLWYDTANNELKVNIGKYLGEANWIAISGKTMPLPSNLLRFDGGTLAHEMFVIGTPINDNNVVSREYADSSNAITFSSKNDNYQYNIMNHNGFVTLNGTVRQSSFNNSTFTVNLPFNMKDINYSVTLSSSSNGEYIPGGDNSPLGHHYYVTSKQLSSFRIIIDPNLPSNGEIDFCLVGFVQQ